MLYLGQVGIDDSGRAHNFHGNMTGLLFRTLHVMFDQQYSGRLSKVMWMLPSLRE